MKARSTWLVGIWLCAASALAEPPTPGHPHHHHHGGPALDFPALSPAESLRRMQVEPGLEVTLVASEPLVDAPVAARFGPDGKLWVVEMPDFMSDLNGSRESQPSGRVVYLEDTDGDGIFDKRTIFVDNLVLPRAIAPFADGVLVGHPPFLDFWRDTKGTGRANERTVVAEDYEKRGTNPEYQPNGLLTALDNWIYSAQSPRRFRREGTRWISEETKDRGQWGIAQDELGRLFFNFNEMPVMADLIPSEKLLRQRYAERPTGVNEKLSHDLRVWPGHPTLAITDPTQAKDGQLAHFTAAAGILVYRSDLFPAAFRDNVFVDEPAGNLVQRFRLVEPRATPDARIATPGIEVLRSTDPRFRPVNVLEGPEGAIYVVDMYRGVIQHRTYLTQALETFSRLTGLDRGLGRGRIYRLQPRGAHPQKLAVDRFSTAQLIALLDDGRAWVRDQAQQLLVAKQDFVSEEALVRYARSAPGWRGRLHAWWVLEGWHRLTPPLLRQAVRQENDPAVLSTLVRLSEPYLAKDEPLLAAVRGLVGRKETKLRLQLLAVLGGLTDASTVSAVHRLVTQEIADPLFRATYVLTQRGRELAARAEWARSPTLVRELTRATAPLPEPPAPPPPPTLTQRWHSTTHALALTIRQFLHLPPLTKTGHQEAGEQTFLKACAACHGADGGGTPALAPSLHASQILPHDLAVVALLQSGLKSAEDEATTRYAGSMPSFSSLSTSEVADLINYVRGRWAPASLPIGARDVKRLRARTASQVGPWTRKTLQRLWDATPVATPSRR